MSGKMDITKYFKCDEEFQKYLAGLLLELHDDKVLDQQILIDFTQHPELLQSIRETAGANFRTVELQILWLIKMSVAEYAE